MEILEISWKSDEKEVPSISISRYESFDVSREVFGVP
jgi:hypothetical protein